MRAKTSPVWRYFTDCVQDPRHALCKICKLKVSRGSADPSKRSTKPLDDHLKNFHSKEYSIVRDLKIQSSNISNPNGSASSSTSSIQDGNIDSDDIKISKLRSKQERKEAFACTISNWVEQAKKVGFHTEKGQAFHKSVFEMLIMDLLPFTHVNDLGFLRHHQKFLPNFEIASDKYYRSLLEPTFHKVKAKLMIILKEAKPIVVVLSLDGWSQHHFGYIGINIHFFQGWKRKSFHLACQPFTKSHTGDNIREFVEEHAQD